MKRRLSIDEELADGVLIKTSEKEENFTKE